MAFSIRLSEDERALAESYAKLHSITLSEAFKRALFERIEDEYDVMIGQEAYDEYIANQRKSRPVSELWKDCDL
ncbi:MAG: antitoxin [Clostridia bacterium]|nr:antitoxin [Clostridia bacterium]